MMLSHSGYRLLIAMGAVCIGAMGALLIVDRIPPKDAAVGDLRTCFSDEGRPWDEVLACVHDKTRTLLGKLPAHELMNQVEAALPQQCHTIGHIVGQETYKLSRTPEDAFASCLPTACVHACTHGVMGEVFLVSSGTEFASEELGHPTLALIRSKTERMCKDRTTCHAVGHALFLLLSDLIKALTVCDEAASLDAVGCYSGVFMENGAATFANTIPEVPRGKRAFRDPSDLLSPCGEVAAPYQPACFRFLYTNQPITFRERGITDPKEMFDLQVEACETVKVAANRSPCFKSIAWSLHDAGFPLSEVQTLCITIVGGLDSGACLFGMGDTYGDQGAAAREVADQCASIENTESRRLCYRGLFTALSDKEEGLLDRACEQGVDVVCDISLKEFIAEYVAP